MPVLKQRKSHKRLVGILVAAVFGMLLFSFALVPLYDKFCEVTGINSKGGLVRMEVPTEIDTDRTVRIRFMTHVNGDMPWEFYTEEQSIDVHPGEVSRVLFHAQNPTEHDMMGQFVATVTPGTGNRYVKKTECFSFDEQMIRAQTDKNMSVVFFIDRSIPDHIEEITMFYSLFDTTPGANS